VRSLRVTSAVAGVALSLMGLLACGGLLGPGPQGESGSADTSAPADTSAARGEPRPLTPKWLSLGPSASRHPERTGPWLAFDGDPSTTYLDPEVGVAAWFIEPVHVVRVRIDSTAPTTVQLTGFDKDGNVVKHEATLDQAGSSVVELGWSDTPALFVAAPGVPLREIEILGHGASASAADWQWYTQPRGGVEGSSPRVGVNETDSLWTVPSRAGNAFEMPDGKGGLFWGKLAKVSLDDDQLTIEAQDGRSHSWDVFRLGCMLVVQDVILTADPCVAAE